MNNRGFTLVELMVSIAILSAVTLLGLLAFKSSTASINLASAKSEAQAGIRELLTVIQGEVELASKEDRITNGLNVARLQINEEPAEFSPIEVAFQIPVDDNGATWSDIIRYRYITEDLNGNGFLDGGEDVDNDGVLTRRIVRISEAPDGREVSVPIGGVNNITDVQFYFPPDNEEVLMVSITAEAAIKGTRVRIRRGENPLGSELRVTSTVTSAIYLLN